MTAEEHIKGCEHDGSFIPVTEVIRLMEAYAKQEMIAYDKWMSRNHFGNILPSPEMAVDQYIKSK